MNAAERAEIDRQVRAMWEADCRSLQNTYAKHYAPGMFRSWTDVGLLLLKVVTVYLVICGAAANIIWWLT